MSGQPDIKTVTPDEVIYAQWGEISLNATLVHTWMVMAVLLLISHLATRRLSSGVKLGRWQNLLEILIGGVRKQIAEISNQNPDRYLPFVGTIFLFILTSNILAIVPGFYPPTASLSTTAALAGCVFLAVPIYGIRERGWANYLRQYLQPTPLMLPFNILGELSRTLALAVRLFGNAMSGMKIAAILLAIVPLVFPVVMQVMGLLTGVIQAYIFAVLSVVYISSASQAHEESRRGTTSPELQPQP